MMCSGGGRVVNTVGWGDERETVGGDSRKGEKGEAGSSPLLSRALLFPPPLSNVRAVRRQ